MEVEAKIPLIPLPILFFPHFSFSLPSLSLPSGISRILHAPHPFPGISISRMLLAQFLTVNSPDRPQVRGFSQILVENDSIPVRTGTLECFPCHGALPHPCWRDGNSASSSGFASSSALPNGRFPDSRMSQPLPAAPFFPIEEFQIPTQLVDWIFSTLPWKYHTGLRSFFPAPQKGGGRGIP